MQFRDKQIEAKVWVPIIGIAVALTGYLLWNFVLEKQETSTAPFVPFPYADDMRASENSATDNTTIQDISNAAFDGKYYKLSELPQNYGVDSAVWISKGETEENRIYIATTYVTQGVVDIQVRAYEERTLRPIWTTYVTNKLPEFARQTPIIRAADGFPYVFWRECFKATGFCQLRVQKFDAKGKRLFGESGRQLLADERSMDVDYQAFIDYLRGYSDSIYAVSRESLFKTNTSAQVLWKKALPLSGYMVTSLQKAGVDLLIAYSYDNGIYVEKIDGATGETIWKKRVDVQAMKGVKFGPKLFYEGQTISVVWADFRSGKVDPGIFAMQLSADGTPQWDREVEVADIEKAGFDAGVDFKNNIYVVWSHGGTLYERRINQNGGVSEAAPIDANVVDPIFISEGNGMAYTFWRGEGGERIMSAIIADDQIFSPTRIDTAQYVESGQVVSDKLNSSPVSEVTLRAEEVKPGGTNVKYFVSDEEGNWTEVQLGAKHVFKTPVQELYWRIELSTTKTEATPLVSDITVDWK